MPGKHQACYNALRAHQFTLARKLAREIGSPWLLRKVERERAWVTGEYDDPTDFWQERNYEEVSEDV